MNTKNNKNNNMNKNYWKHNTKILEIHNNITMWLESNKQLPLVRW